MQLAAMAAGSPLLAQNQAAQPPRPQRIYPPTYSDEVMSPVNVHEIEDLARRKVQPLAYDYIAGGSAGELTLQANRTGERYPPSGFWRGRLHLWRLDTPMRLALEMAAHEETERLYLASHLSLLETAWREAEEIANISDDLLIPEWIRQRLSPG